MNGPDFVGIGAQECGTTWTYTQFLRHPDIRFPGGKDVQFWSRHREKGLEWYSGLFEGVDGVKGDISPTYAYLQPNVIAKIHELFPNLRIFYLIRDPIERVWSGALKRARQIGLSPETIPDGWFISEFESEESILRTSYRACLQNWVNVFGRESILVLDRREMVERPREFLQKIAGHVGVDPEFFGELNEKSFKRGFNPNAKLEMGEDLRCHAARMYGSAPYRDWCGYPLTDWEKMVANEEESVLLKRRLSDEWFTAGERRGIHISIEKVFLPRWLNFVPEPETDYEWFPFDTRKGLLIGDESFDFGYIRLVLERLGYKQSLGLLQEIFRVLRKGGRLRLHCKDLVKITKFSTESSGIDEKIVELAVERYCPSADFYSGTQLVNYFIGNSGYKFIFDFAELRRLLEEIGFVDVRLCRIRDGADSELYGVDRVIDGLSGLEEFLSMFIETRKP